MRWWWVLLALAGSAAHALSGEVTHVTDGDTLWVRASEGKPVKVRLLGIDAPERCQAWGPQARDALTARVLHKHVDIDTRAVDDYQRTLGKLVLNGEDIGAWMVLQGHAWSYRYRRSAGPYAAQQQQARIAHRGLFAANDAMEPRAFRKAHGPCEMPPR